jgi:hypothetical protein
VNVNLARVRRVPGWIVLVSQPRPRPKPQVILKEIYPLRSLWNEFRQMQPGNTWVLMMRKMKIEIQIDRPQETGHFQIVRTIQNISRTKCVIDVVL